jgi:tetratricopeptide (TPR) repeat protein
MINERYAEALEQYRKINYGGPMAMAALHAGDYGLPESLPQGLPKKGSARFGILGDLAAARGQLDQAVPYYEQAAANYQTMGPLRPWFGLLSAARIHLEQNRPEEVLAMGRRHDHPWAAGLRGTAYVLLNQDAEAEKEFADLRHSIAPVLGDYIAGETVEFHRMQAALYAGHFDRVIQMWTRLPRSWWSLYALDVGRAYLRSGLFTEAEYHLRLARKAQQAYFMNGDMQAQHNLLTWMLAQFYLAEVLEKIGRRAEAIAQYQAFVKHFESSSPPLPQIAAARAFLEQFRLSDRGKLLFSDEFSGDTLEPGWAGNPGAGNWQVAGGLVTVSKRPREAGLTTRRRFVAYHDAIFEFSFRTDGDGWIGLNLARERSVLAQLMLGPGVITLKVREPAELGGSTLAAVDRLVTTLEPGAWHKVVVQVDGKRIIAHVDDKPAVAGEIPALDVDKTDFALSVEGARASFDYVRMYEVASK